MHRRLLFASILAIIATCASATGTFAQALLGPLLRPTESNTTPLSGAPPAPVATKRAENAELLRVAQRKLEVAGPADASAAQAVALYTTIETVLAQEETVDQQIKDLTAKKGDLEGQLQIAHAAGAEEPPTLSFLELDRVKDELNAEQARVKLGGAKLAAAKAALDKAQTAFDECEKVRRQTQEAVETAQATDNASELGAAADQAKQASKLAAETIALRKKEVDREELAQDVQKLNVQVLQQQVDVLGSRVNFSNRDLEDQLAKIKKQEDGLNAALDRAQTNSQSVLRQLTFSRQKYDESIGDRTLPGAQWEAWQRARDKLDLEINLLTQQIQRLADVRLAWNHRYQIAAARSATVSEANLVARGPTSPVEPDDLRVWQAATKARLDELASDSRTQILRMAELRGDLATVARKIDATKDGPPELAEWLDTQRRSLEETLRLHETDLVAIESNRRVHERLLAEIGRDVEALSPKQLAISAWDQAVAVWNYELTEIGGRGITVQKVVKALVIFVTGWMLSRILSTVFVNRFLRRFRFSKDATAVVRTLTSYMLLLVTTLFALNAINVPLTAFTILGGALAIGVGFGSQALINNFISGLIMLAERPVRIGEQIEFGVYKGVVEEVGFRSTKLRTANDHLVTIPNSNLVNEPIENVGRRRTIRRVLQLTISYDTPREQIRQAVDSIRGILEEPGIREPIHPIIGWDKLPPRVHFNEFNAESLNIQVLYWYAPPDHWEYMEHMQRVNLRIYEEFERLGISFAIPSRTVYLAADAKHGPAALDQPGGFRAAS